MPYTGKIISKIQDNQGWWVITAEFYEDGVPIYQKTMSFEILPSPSQLNNKLNQFITSIPDRKKDEIFYEAQTLVEQIRRIMKKYKVSTFQELETKLKTILGDSYGS